MFEVVFIESLPLRGGWRGVRQALPLGSEVGYQGLGIGIGPQARTFN